MTIDPIDLPRLEYRRRLQNQRMFEGVDYFRLHHKDTSGKKYETAGRDFIFYWFGKKTITITGLFRTDGATCAKDLCALAWHVHDWICEVPYFDDGAPISNLRASWIYRQILIWHGIKVRSRLRFVFTFLFGGKRVKRLNGWI